MKAAFPVLGLVLIAAGALGLVNGGFSYFYDDKIDIGPIHTSVQREKKVPISPLLGAIALASGIGLLVWTKKKE